MGVWSHTSLILTERCAQSGATAARRQRPLPGERGRRASSGPCATPDLAVFCNPAQSWLVLRLDPELTPPLFFSSLVLFSPNSCGTSGIENVHPDDQATVTLETCPS